MATNIIELKLHKQDFKLPGLRFSVSGRKVDPNLDMLHYLKLNYPYLDISTIDSVFGAALFPSRLYGGRPHDIKHSLTWIHFKQLQELNINFSITLTNHFVDEAEYEQSFDFLEKHHRTGNSIVCHSDWLALRIRSDFPRYTLRASIMKGINTLEKAARCLELYDQIVIPMEMNDDDVFLEQLPCKERVMLFANAGCAYSCRKRSCWQDFSHSNQGRAETSDCSQAKSHLKNVDKTFFNVGKFHDMGFQHFKLIPSAIPHHLNKVAETFTRHKTAATTISQHLKKPLFHLSSFPKSGRTWVRFLLANYLNLQFNLKLQINFKTFFLLLPHNNLDEEKGVGVYDYYDDTRFPLIVATHNAYDESMFFNNKVIFLLRSVHDTLVSNYFQHTRVFTDDCAWKGDLKEFIRSREYGVHAVCAYLNSWSNHLKSNQNSLVLSYENLHADTAAALKRLLTYLEIPVNQENLRLAMAASSFTAMKKVEQESTIPGKYFNFSREDENCARVRRGKVGGYTDYLDAADITFITDICDAELSAQSKKLLAQHTSLNTYLNLP